MNKKDMDLEGTFICLYDEITGKTEIFNILQVIEIDFNEQTLLFSNNGVVKTNDAGMETIWKWMTGRKLKYSEIKSVFSDYEEMAQQQ